jgi:serine/threonine protein kinase
MDDLTTRVDATSTPQTYTLQRLGYGSFGKVWLLTDRLKNTQYAYKVCKLFRNDNPPRIMVVDNVIREITFLSYIRSARRSQMTYSDENLSLYAFLNAPASIPSADIVWSDATDNPDHSNIPWPKSTDSVAIKMKYAGYPLSVYKYMDKHELVALLLQLLQACAWLHRRRWSHGDLKPSNVLIQKNKLTLIDYGSLLFTDKYTITSQRCTLYYVSPEELVCGRATPANDVWSFGAMLFEVLTGKIFVLALLRYLGMTQLEIESFQEHLNDETNEKSTHESSKQILQRVYRDLMYGRVVEFLHKHVKDREWLDVLVYCCMMDVSHRCTMNDLLYKDGLFASFTSLQRPQPVLTNSYLKALQHILWKHHQADFLSLTEELSYQKQTHASIDSHSRRALIASLIECIQQLVNTSHQVNVHDEIFLHTVMLFDRYTLREEFVQNNNASCVQQKWSDQEKRTLWCIGLACCLYLSLCLMQTYVISIQSLEKLVRRIVSLYQTYLQTSTDQADMEIDMAYVNRVMEPKSLQRYLVRLLQLLECRPYNMCPDLIVDVLIPLGTTSHKTFTEQDIQRSVDASLHVPWSHSLLPLLTAWIFETDVGLLCAPSTASFE